MRLRRRSDEQDEPEGQPGPAEVSGLEEPDVIEFIVEEVDGCIGLLMTENRPWNGGSAQVEQLLAKVSTYVGFATKGGLAEHVPGSEGAPVRVVLHTAFPPDGEIVEALPVVEEGLADIGIDFEVRTPN